MEAPLRINLIILIIVRVKRVLLLTCFTQEEREAQISHLVRDTQLLRAGSGIPSAQHSPGVHSPDRQAASLCLGPMQTEGRKKAFWGRLGGGGG